MKSANLNIQLGFTLIELMVAVAIIAIISVIGTTLFGQAQKNARDGQRINEIGEIQNALEQFYATNNGYPAVGTANASATVSNISVLSSYFSNNVPPSDPNNTEVSYQYTYYSCGGDSTATPIKLATQYVVCAKLVNPTGKANMDAVPTNGCANLTTPSAAVYFCKKSLSN